MKVKKEGQGKLFKNPLLEVFTKTNPVLHAVTYGGASMICASLNQLPLNSTLYLFPAGIFTWTLVEYLIHRFLFHIMESKFQYTIHGVHHEFPKDRERLMMPPLPGSILVCLFYGFWYLFLGNYTPLFMCGFLTGYLGYTFIHYMVHAWKPIPGIKFLWSHHLKHHNPAFEDKAFGVSTPLWDMLFGTMPTTKNSK